MHAILFHGTGCTPIAMSILAARLRASDIRPHLFDYSVTFERWDECIQRLENFITKRVKTNEYIMIGHSLGSILTRATLPRLIHHENHLYLLGREEKLLVGNALFSYKLSRIEKIVQ